MRLKQSAASLERSSGRLERSGFTCCKTSLSLHLLHLTPFYSANALSCTRRPAEEYQSASHPNLKQLFLLNVESQFPRYYVPGYIGTYRLVPCCHGSCICQELRDVVCHQQLALCFFSPPQSSSKPIVLVQTCSSVLFRFYSGIRALGEEL